MSPLDFILLAVASVLYITIGFMEGEILEESKQPENPSVILDTNCTTNNKNERTFITNVTESNDTVHLRYDVAVKENL